MENKAIKLPRHTTTQNNCYLCDAPKCQNVLLPPNSVEFPNNNNNNNLSTYIQHNTLCTNLFTFHTNIENLI